MRVKVHQYGLFSDLVEKVQIMCAKSMLVKVYQYGLFSDLVEKVQIMCENYMC